MNCINCGFPKENHYSRESVTRCHTGVGKYEETYVSPTFNEGKNWFVIGTTGMGSRATFQIQSLLDRLDYEGLLFSPSVRSTVTKKGKQKNNDKPIFSSYTFIQAAITNSKLEQSLIEAKLGHFLKLPHDETHDLPTPISQEDMDNIKALEEADIDPIEEEIIDIGVGNLVEILVGGVGMKGIVNEIRGRTAVVETFVFGRSALISVNIAHILRIAENIKDEKPTE